MILGKTGIGEKWYWEKLILGKTDTEEKLILGKADIGEKLILGKTVIPWPLQGDPAQGQPGGGTSTAAPATSLELQGTSPSSAQGCSGKVGESRNGLGCKGP